MFSVGVPMNGDVDSALSAAGGVPAIPKRRITPAMVSVKYDVVHTLFTYCNYDST
jgi:hypothetical protein